MPLLEHFPCGEEKAWSGMDASSFCYIASLNITQRSKYDGRPLLRASKNEIKSGWFKSCFYINKNKLNWIKMKQNFSKRHLFSSASKLKHSTCWGSKLSLSRNRICHKITQSNSSQSACRSEPSRNSYKRKTTCNVKNVYWKALFQASLNIFLV